MPDESAVLLQEQAGGVRILTLNRPDALNALNAELRHDLLAAINAARRDDATRAIILTGAGRGFCAGGDVTAMGGGSEVSEATFEQRVDRQNRIHEFSRLLWEMPKVTIAAVNGAAAGAGLGLALSCDLCFASERARFGTAFAKVGLGGDFGTTWQLARKVGAAKAKELFFLGELLGAEQAAALGLANRVLPEATFMNDVMDIARRIAHGPLVSYRYMKQNVNMAMSCDFASSLQREAFTHLRCSQTQDHREGVAAFAEKREPKFSGR